MRGNKLKMLTDSNMRLAIYIPSLRGGGAERVMVILANGFAERGYEVDLVLAKAEGPYLKEVADTVRVVDLKSTRVLTSLPGLVRYLRSVRPLALLSAMGHANVVAVVAKVLARVPTRVVVSERNNFSVSKKHARSHRANAMGRLILMRWAYRRAAGVIAISGGVADDLSVQLEIPRDNIKVVYNPLDIERAQVLSRLEPTRIFSDGNGHKLILGIGRLVEQKGFIHLIRAFAQVRSGSSVKLCILGEGPLRESLKAEVERLGLINEIVLPGFVGNPFAVMRQANLFVLSSGWEGFGNVLVEAMACGTPVVSTACPSGPDEILEQGRWGRLVPVGDVDALAAAMAATLDENEHPDVATRAGEFSVDRAVEGYLEVMLMGSKEWQPQMSGS
jgi:glycosyltransferase involved in cell wall biosynthesis